MRVCTNVCEGKGGERQQGHAGACFAEELQPAEAVPRANQYGCAVDIIEPILGSFFVT